TVVVRGLVVVVGAVEVVRGLVVVVLVLELEEGAAVVVGTAVDAACVVAVGLTGFTFGSETTAPATPPVPAAGARCGCRWKLAAA
ncbi:MAG TPA: hypothetical protein VIU44_06155, partial [Gaiellaceae bacterium]